MKSEPDIRVILTDDQPIEVDGDRIVEVAMRTARSEGARGEISITLVDEERMARLHLEYMNETGPTDVLSFPIDGREAVAKKSPDRAERPLEPAPPPVMIGEVVVCPSVAAGAGRDLLSELDLLVAHGVLHLLGYDHEDGAGAAQMAAREKRITGRSGATAE